MLNELERLLRAKSDLLWLKDWEIEWLSQAIGRYSWLLEKLALIPNEKRRCVTNKIIVLDSDLEASLKLLAPPNGAGGALRGEWNDKSSLIIAEQNPSASDL